MDIDMKNCNNNNNRDESNECKVDNCDRKAAAATATATTGAGNGDFLDHGKIGSQKQVSQVLLYGIPIVSLRIESQERLCLAQISNTLLKSFSYNEIHNRRVALGITCVQCTPIQLEILRRAGAMPVSSRRCGMITKREAERLCKSFLGDNSPPRLPDDFMFGVYHECAWGCRGSFLPARYNSSRAKCIKCATCSLFFSPNKFIFHSHRIASNDIYVQPDAANFNSWRRHMKLAGKPSVEIVHAWEDVKAMFNGGTRKRLTASVVNVPASLMSIVSSSSSTSTSPLLSSTPTTFSSLPATMNYLDSTSSLPFKTHSRINDEPNRMMPSSLALVQLQPRLQTVAAVAAAAAAAAAAVSSSSSLIVTSSAPSPLLSTLTSTSTAMPSPFDILYQRQLDFNSYLNQTAQNVNGTGNGNSNGNGNGNTLPWLKRAPFFFANDSFLLKNYPYDSTVTATATAMTTTSTATVSSSSFKSICSLSGINCGNGSSPSNMSSIAAVTTTPPPPAANGNGNDDNDDDDDDDDDEVDIETTEDDKELQIANIEKNSDSEKFNRLWSLPKFSFQYAAAAAAAAAAALAMKSSSSSPLPPSSSATTVTTTATIAAKSSCSPSSSSSSHSSTSSASVSVPIESGSKTFLVYNSPETKLATNNNESCTVCQNGRNQIEKMFQKM